MTSDPYYAVVDNLFLHTINDNEDKEFFEIILSKKDEFLYTILKHSGEGNVTYLHAKNSIPKHTVSFNPYKHEVQADCILSFSRV